MQESARYTSNKKLIINLELDGVLQWPAALLEHGVQSLGLGDCSRKAVKDEATQRVSALCVGES